MTFLHSKKVKTAIKILISLFLITWLIFFVDWHDVWQNLQMLRPSFILLFVGIYLTGIVISAYKWQRLAAFRNFNFRLSQYVSWYVIGTFINNFMPSFIGGDAYRSYALSRRDDAFRQAWSTVIVDRLTGLIGIVILAVIFAMLNLPQAMEHPPLLLLYAGAVGLLVLLLIVLFVRNASWVRSLYAMLPQKVAEYAAELATFRHRGVAREALLLSFVFAFVGVGLANYVLFVAIGAVPPIVPYLGVIFLISVIAAAPISIGNIGVKEWAYVVLFGFFGVSASAAVTVVLLSRILQMLVSFSALPVYLKNSREEGSIKRRTLTDQQKHDTL